MTPPLDDIPRDPWRLPKLAAIDTADEVHHVPTDENWVVAYVRGDSLAWCGWPPGEAALSDCKLIKKATSDQRYTLLRELAESGCNVRGPYARQRLGYPSPQPADDFAAKLREALAAGALRAALERLVRVVRDADAYEDRPTPAEIDEAVAVAEAALRLATGG